MGVGVIGAVSAAAKIEKTQVITSTQSWTVPADVSQVYVTLVSGGGGGGGVPNATPRSGGGGGGGGYRERYLSVTPGSTHTITIGAGGSGGTNSSHGGQGGTSSFGSLFSLIGGGGGRTGDIGLDDVNVPDVACTGGSNGGSSGGAGGGGMGTWISMRSDIGINDNTPGRATIGAHGYVTGGSQNVPGGRGVNGYCGGGAGGAWTGNKAVSSATDGGGFGARVDIAAAVAGAANTGGGGGGGIFNSIQYQGAAGGSGIAIIKYWSAL